MTAVAVTPMDLQVLFMQENRAAKETDRQRRFQSEVRSRQARKNIYRSLSEAVDDIDAAETKTVDEEGRQGSAGYYPRRREREPESSSEPPPSVEEGKGGLLDLQA